MELTYGIFRDELVREFPEMRDDAQIDATVLDEYDEPHAIVALLFDPMMMSAIQERNEALVDRIFAFLERMATSNDQVVVSVLTTGVLERLGNDTEDLRRAIPHMRPQTRELSKEVEVWWHSRKGVRLFKEFEKKKD